MIKFVARRVIQMLILFVLFLTIVFFMLDAMPGNIAFQYIGNPDLPPEARQQLLEELGLDKPLGLQYIAFIGNFFQGDMGVSFSRYPRPVFDVLWEAVPRTVALFLTATVVSYWLGFKAGKLVAWRRNSSSETALVTSGVALQTVFYPWFGIVMLWLFGFIFGWFPIGGFISVGVWTGSPYAATDIFFLMLVTTLAALVLCGLVRLVAQAVTPDPNRRLLIQRAAAVILLAALVAGWWLSPAGRYAWDILYHLGLPVITLTLVSFAAVMLLTRSSMLETLRDDYILTARAKGLPDRVIRDRHAARNALLPVTTSLVLSLAFIIGGGIITETIFSWPGVGRLLLEAIQVEDIPLAIGALSLVGVLALVGHLVADVLYTMLDPRIRI